MNRYDGGASPGGAFGELRVKAHVNFFRQFQNALFAHGGVGKSIQGNFTVDQGAREQIAHTKFSLEPGLGNAKDKAAVSMFRHLDLDRFNHIRRDAVTGSHLKHRIDRVMREPAAGIRFDLQAQYQIVALSQFRERSGISGL